MLYLAFLPYRNNLTVIEAIMVKGQGTTESMRIAGKPAGPGSSLRFKITEALLKDCTESKSSVVKPNIKSHARVREKETRQSRILKARMKEVKVTEVAL